MCMGGGKRAWGLIEAKVIRMHYVHIKSLGVNFNQLKIKVEDLWLSLSHAL